MKFLVLIKKKFISILFILFTILLVLLAQSNLDSAKNGLKLWANNVVPSLFPFFVAVELLKHTNIVYYLSKLLDKFMRPIFNVPGIAVFPLIMGLISGYPVGAKIVNDLYLDNKCTKNEAERILIFTNNAGPLFIVGTVGFSFYSNSSIGIILLFTHILASVTLGIIMGIISRKYNFSLFSHLQNTKSVSYNMELNKDISISELGSIMGTSIVSAIKSILIVGGFVTLFSVIISMLNKTYILIAIANLVHIVLPIEKNVIQAFFTGIIEFTNGLSFLASVPLKNISLKLVISAFILGFGGISVTLQTLSIISKSKLSIKRYVLGRIMQGIISGLYTYIIFCLPIFNLNL